MNKCEWNYIMVSGGYICPHYVPHTEVLMSSLHPERELLIMRLHTLYLPPPLPPPSHLLLEIMNKCNYKVIHHANSSVFPLIRPGKFIVFVTTGCAWKFWLSESWYCRDDADEVLDILVSLARVCVRSICTHVLDLSRMCK